LKPGENWYTRCSPITERKTAPMSKNGNGNSDLYLKIGLALAIQRKAEGEFGVILKTISPGQLGLELSRPTPRLPL